MGHGKLLPCHLEGKLLVVNGCMIPSTNQMDLLKDTRQDLQLRNRQRFVTNYHKLKSDEGEKEVFKLVKARKRRTRDLGSVRYIKDEDGRLEIDFDGFF